MNLTSHIYMLAASYINLFRSIGQPSNFQRDKGEEGSNQKNPPWEGCGYFLKQTNKCRLYVWSLNENSWHKYFKKAKLIHEHDFDWFGSVNNKKKNFSIKTILISKITDNHYIFCGVSPLLFLFCRCIHFHFIMQVVVVAKLQRYNKQARFAQGQSHHHTRCVYTMKSPINR